MTPDVGLRVEVNGRTSARVRQGDRVRFVVDGVDPATHTLEVDFEGSGQWTRIDETTFVHIYRQPGRFATAVRAGDLTAIANVHVTRVTGTGGGGFF
jgi:hypothetical protein